MCPKMKDGVCEIVDIAPEYIECVDENLLCEKDYQYCKVYILAKLLRIQKKIWLGPSLRNQASH